MVSTARPFNGDAARSILLELCADEGIRERIVELAEARLSGVDVHAHDHQVSAFTVPRLPEVR
jgi:hypothetical protein